MSGRTTAVLFVILLLLAGFLIWQNQQEDEPEIATVQPTPRPGPVIMLADYEIADLHRLAVTHVTTGAALDYLYDHEAQPRWRLAEGGEPFEGGMMDVHVPAFLGLRYTRAIDITEQTSLADFGLDPPEYEITIELRGENGRWQTYTYHIGGRTIDQLGYYVQQEGVDDLIYIIPSGFISNITNILNDPILPP